MIFPPATCSSFSPLVDHSRGGNYLCNPALSQQKRVSIESLSREIGSRYHPRRIILKNKIKEKDRKLKILKTVLVSFRQSLKVYTQTRKLNYKHIHTQKICIYCIIRVRLYLRRNERLDVQNVKNPLTAKRKKIEIKLKIRTAGIEKDNRAGNPRK